MVPSLLNEGVKVDAKLPEPGGLGSNGTELLGKASFRPPRRGRAGFLSGRSSPRAILSGSEKA